MHRSKLLFWLFLVLGATTASAVPFSYVYRFDPISYFRNDGRYLLRQDYQFHAIAGQIRNTTFDGLIVGSSLSGNLNPRIFEEGFHLKKVRNASAFGALLADRIAVAQLAIRKQPTLKTIFFEIKPMNIEGACRVRSSRFPTYLFDKNPLNDVLYFMSADMVFISKVKRAGIGDFFTTNPDQAARWLEAHAAHVASAPARMNSLIAKVRNEAPSHRPIDIDAKPMSDEARRQFHCGADALYRLVAENPTIRFVFFEPPEHISLVWRRYSGEAGPDAPAVKQAFLHRMHSLPNFEYHDFGDRLADMSAKCGAFVDETHFLPVVSDRMQNDIVAGTARETEQSYPDRLRALLEKLDLPDLCEVEH
jgi:hypothetical protein